MHLYFVYLSSKKIVQEENKPTVISFLCLFSSEILRRHKRNALIHRKTKMQGPISNISGRGTTALYHDNAPRSSLIR